MKPLSMIHLGELAQQAIALTSFALPPVLLSSGLLRACRATVPRPQCVVRTFPLVCFAAGKLRVRYDPLLPLHCNSLAGTSRTAAGKRMWCTAHGCTWSAVVAEDALTGRDMCAVGGGGYFDGKNTTTPGPHLESDAQKG